MSVSETVASYVESRGAHWAGSMWRHQIEAIERVYSTAGFTLETGCGTSTILLSNLSAHHVVFCYDDRDRQNSSVDFVLSAPAFDASRTEFVFGPTQLTLPKFKFTEKLGLALIDGPHAFPFPELEYYYIYPHLKEGAILILDDVHIPTLYNLYCFLKEERMFSLVERVAQTALFRRTEAPTFDPFGDGWEFQEFNNRRFPRFPRYSGSDLLSQYTPDRLRRIVPTRVRRAIKARLGNLYFNK